MRQAALAVDYLNEPKHGPEGHPISIQHRDIRPENILLIDGAVQVRGLGIALPLEGSIGNVSRENRAFAPMYAAPELYKDILTRWTDQYALALTYYKLRTGFLPLPDFIGRIEIMMAHVEGKLDFSRSGHGKSSARASDVVTAGTALPDLHGNGGCTGASSQGGFTDRPI